MIRLTQEDIDNGEQCSGWNCPIVLALKRIFPNKFIYVSTEGIQIGWYDYWHTKETFEFMQRYDKGFVVEPMEFELGNKKEN